MRVGGCGIPEGERYLCRQQVCLDRFGHTVPVSRGGQVRGVAQETAAALGGRETCADKGEPCERLPASVDNPAFRASRQRDARFVPRLEILEGAREPHRRGQLVGHDLRRLVAVAGHADDD